MPIPKEKKYTADEFFALIPETNEHIELINGEIIAQAAPSLTHQRLVKKISSEIDKYIEFNKGKCEVIQSPFDVKLDYRTVVQPDILVICDPSKLDEKRCNGAPDFVVEVVSGNGSDDYIRKLDLYRKSGVREYWIVDPQAERIAVYIFGKELELNIYTFSQPVPVRIYDGKLELIIADMLV
ncbi:MAG: Uma2 family endonuclease [Ruminococcus sp.]|nr:Uma2 family endonuclease [Ruminococcus sp.]